MHFAKLLHQNIFGTIRSDYSEDYRLGLSQRVGLVSIFSLLAILFGLVYSIVLIRDHNQRWDGYMMIFLTITVIGNIILIRWSKSIELASSYLVFLGIPAILPWLITGGPLSQGYFWTLVYIPWAFILVGRKRSSIWLSTYFVISVGIMWLGHVGSIKVSFSWSEFLQIAFMSAITFTLLYAYDTQSAFFENLAYKALDALEESSNKK